MTSTSPSTSGLDAFLAVLDRLPFVASLKKDVGALQSLVVRRRVPRIVSVGDRVLGRKLFGMALVDQPTPNSVLPASEGAMASSAGGWVRITGPRGSVDWLELDVTPLAEQLPGATARATQLTRPMQRPDVILWVLSESAPAQDSRVYWKNLLEPVVLGFAAADDGGDDPAKPSKQVPLVAVRAAGEGNAREVLDNESIKAVLAELGQPEAHVVRVAVSGESDADRGVDPGDGMAKGILELSDALFACLPDEAQLEAARTLVHADRARRGVAGRVVHSCSTLALTVGLAPVPLSDVVLILPLQLLMVSVIAYLGGRDLDRRTALEWVTSMGVVGGAGMGLRWTAQQLAKLIPGAGTVVSGSVAGAGTVALGQSAIAYFLAGPRSGSGASAPGEMS